MEYIATAFVRWHHSLLSKPPRREPFLRYLPGRHHVTTLLGSHMVKQVLVTACNMQAAANVNRCYQVGACAFVGEANGRLILVREGELSWYAIGFLSWYWTAHELKHFTGRLLGKVSHSLALARPQRQ